MRSPLQAVKRRGDTGKKLPRVWDTFGQLGIDYRRGQVSITAAATGGGKSAVALAYAIQSQVPTLYFSADTPAIDQCIRGVQSLTGMSKDEVEAIIDSPYVAAQLAKFDNIRWCDDTLLTKAIIHDEVMAYHEIYGAYPELIVVDNLINAKPKGDNDWSAIRELVDGMLVPLAANTEAHVMALAHVRSQYSNGNVPIPLNGLENQPSNNVRLTLTLLRDGCHLKVYPVKNTHGVSSPDAKLCCHLFADMSTMIVRSWSAGDNLRARALQSPPQAWGYYEDEPE